MASPSLKDRVEACEVKIAELKKNSHSPTPVPNKFTVLEWIARDRAERRKAARERAFFSGVVIVLGVFTVWGIGSAFNWLMSVLS